MCSQQVSETAEKHGYVAKPSCCNFSRNGTRLALLGFVRIDDTGPALVESFVSKERPGKVEMNAPWVVLEREVVVSSVQGLRREAAKMASEIGDHFGIPHVSVH